MRISRPLRPYAANAAARPRRRLVVLLGAVIATMLTTIVVPITAGAASVLQFDTNSSATDPDEQEGDEQRRYDEENDDCTSGSVDSEGRRNRPTKVVVPSASHPTIQSGIADVAPCGTVEILAGSYREKLWVAGKHIVLEGTTERGEDGPSISWDRQDRVVPSAEAEGVVNVVAGGSVRVRDLTLRGADAGIVSRDADRVANGPISVADTTIEGTGRGILHLSAAPLVVTKSTIKDVALNGISLVAGPICGGLDLKSTIFGGIENIGVYVRDCAATIHDAEIVGAQGGGIVALRSQIAVTDSSLSFSRYWGILLMNSAGTITANGIFATVPGPNPCCEDEIFGDGITAVTWANYGGSPSWAHVEGNFVYGSARAAASLYGGYMAIKDNQFALQSFDLLGIGGFTGEPFILDELGGNECDTDGNSGWGVCAATGEGLQPPPPKGGLE